MQTVYKNIMYFAGLVMIFILGIFIYFYKLDKIPSGFYIDEALPGYNAYSILKTGKDEYGKNLPVSFRFYGSYNPPLYTYLIVPSLVLFGLNIFAVRFPSALFGLSSAVVFYLMLKKSELIRNKLSLHVGFLLFLISPWNILYSRVGYEVSLGLLLFSIGVLALWLGLKKRGWFTIGLLVLSLSTYAAYAERFLAPIVIFAYLLIYRNIIFGKSRRDHTVSILILTLLTQIPNLYLMTTPAFFPKGEESFVSLVITQTGNFNKMVPFWIAFLINFVKEFLAHYLAYFSPRSLFFLPDPDLQRSIPELSVFYFWVVIPYLFGVYWLYKNRSKNYAKYLAAILFLAPIPASLTKDPFSTHRALPLLFPLMLVIAFGLDDLIDKLSFKMRICIITPLILISLLFLWRSYFVLLASERAVYWGYGIEKLATEINKNPEEHFVIDQSRIKPPYIQLAFFLKYPPQEFQKLKPDVLENYYSDLQFDNYYRFANIETRGINWETDIYKEQILVGDELTISEKQKNDHKLEKLFEIRDPVNTIVLVGFKTNPREKCRSVFYKDGHCKKQ